MSDTQTKIDDFFQAFPSFSFPKGTKLLEPSQEPSSVFYLVTGFVRQYLLTPTGEDLTIHFYKPGSFFPLFWVINNDSNPYFFEAQTPITCIKAPKSDVLSFIQANPDVQHSIISRLLRAIDGLTTRLTYLTHASAGAKIQTTLLFLKKHFGDHLEGFTHEDISKIAGLTRETTSRELEKLQKQGKIIQQGSQLRIQFSHVSA